MEFGWISLFGASMVILIMIPNIIYAVKQKQIETQEKVPQYLVLCEQIGRYSCIVLMWMPLLVWKFGFESVRELVIYINVNGVLLLSYYLSWMRYWRKKTVSKAIVLAVIPTMIFLISGILLHHWLLVAATVLFGVAHCEITYIAHNGYENCVKK